MKEFIKTKFKNLISGFKSEVIKFYNYKEWSPIEWASMLITHGFLLVIIFLFLWIII